MNREAYPKTNRVFSLAVKLPEVFWIQAWLLETWFGPTTAGKAAFPPKVLESSDLTQVVVYRSCLHKLRDEADVPVPRQAGGVLFDEVLDALE
ncbi:PREDICTED: developmental pluripotency-associated 5 protein, partial [Bison bison bison]|uniref:Developmental pluripotency-associated 5 protein n=1 Tax=Bison bison bison TaxID=43346 RepID=A0A6P3HFH1_BISBB